MQLQLLVEYLRMMKMSPLASIVDKIFELYVDEKDAGPLVLANLYLMAGGSKPCLNSELGNWLLVLS